jgi:microcystin-dependent protein
VDEALDGVTTIPITGDVVLTSSNYVTDQARKRVLRLTGSPGASYIVTIPGVEKYYVVHNTTSSPQQLRAGGLAATVPANTLTYVYCDGTDCFAPGATINAAIGAIMDFAGSAAPSGWLLCYGQAVSRVTYSSLFQVIATTYGTGDGSTTFNVPDLRGRTGFGKDDMGGSAASRITAGVSGVTGTTLGATGGHQDIPLHNHGITEPNGGAGHSHGITQPAHSHGVNEGSGGSGHAHGLTDTGHTHNYQRYQLIGGGSSVAAGSGFSISDVSTASLGSNNTSAGLTVNFATTGISIQGNTANVTVNNNASGITINNRGSGTGANVPPALILNKIIYSGV